MKLLPPDPWHRLTEETAEEHAQFIAWLEDPARGIPTNQDLAKKHDWATRALAYQTNQELEQDPRKCLQATLGLMAKGTLVEAGKLTSEIMTSRRSVLTPRDLLAFMAALTQLDKDGVWFQEGEELKDLSELTDDEFAQLEKAAKLMRKKVG